MMQHLSVICAVALLSAGTATVASAQSVKITQDIASKRLTLNGQPVSISRIQDETHTVSGEFALTSRACPPHCIQPMQIAPGIETLGELEVIAFLEAAVASGVGLLLDTRMPERFASGSVPGAVNLPFATLRASNPHRADILRALGGREAAGRWDFTSAPVLTLFCDGPWSDHSHQAAKDLIALGFPPGKLKYFRGGMQSWVMLGLGTTTNPAQ